MAALSPFIEINGRRIGPGYPTYIIAEMSGNHHQRLDEAVAIVRAAKKAGADAIKLQTYTPDTITLDCTGPAFQIPEGTSWGGRTLHDLYSEAFTPWEWHEPLKEVASQLHLDFFSTPFDESAVDFLERMDVQAYKIASFELVDHELIQRVARTGKPVIMSTGMATMDEVTEAVAAIQSAGGCRLALLKCTSAYPAPPSEMNLTAIQYLHQQFGVPTGISDHTLREEVAVAAVALGAAIVEKHLTLSRSVRGPDSAFSLEPHEFESLVKAIRTVESAIGQPDLVVTPGESQNRIFRRSLFVTADVRSGERLTRGNVRSVRPGFGLAPRHLNDVLGRAAARDIPRGTPLTWDLVTSTNPAGDES